MPGHLFHMAYKKVLQRNVLCKNGYSELYFLEKKSKTVITFYENHLGTVFENFLDHLHDEASNQWLMKSQLFFVNREKNFEKKFEARELANHIF